jgi:uncharacterized protein (DUF433 family)
VSQAVTGSYPHIVQNAAIRGGEPVVEGTRIPVAAIVRAHQLGLEFDEILVQLPSLRPEGLHAALLYYLDHQSEIDVILARDAGAPPGATEVEP